LVRASRSRIDVELELVELRGAVEGYFLFDHLFLSDLAAATIMKNGRSGVRRSLFVPKCSTARLKQIHLPISIDARDLGLRQKLV
jgi:hypothetical protein